MTEDTLIPAKFADELDKGLRELSLDYRTVYVPLTELTHQEYPKVFVYNNARHEVKPVRGMEIILKGKFAKEQARKLARVCHRAFERANSENEKLVKGETK